MKHISGPNSRSSLTGVQPKDIQPNAVDLRLGKVFLIRPSTFTITEDEKVHRGSIELRTDQYGYYVLEAGSYEVVMENTITVGEGEAGWVITRSTLNRNGVHLSTGLFDTGYSGVMTSTMHVTCGPMRIKPGTRIGQYLSFNSESLHQYNGSYGIGTEDDTKYGVPTLPSTALLNITEAPQNPILELNENQQLPEQPVKRGRGRPRKVQG